MLNTTKNAVTTNVEKNKLNTVMPAIKKKMQKELNKKIKFHRSLEAFSDCV